MTTQTWDTTVYGYMGKMTEYDVAMHTMFSYEPIYQNIVLIFAYDHSPPLCTECEIYY